MQRDKDGKIIFERYDVTIEMLENLARIFDALNTRLLPIILSVSAIHPPRLLDTPQEPPG